jgi:uncharacterized Ntn-hydrolase superfamily protein
MATAAKSSSKKAPAKRAMSTDHKQKLAQGRNESRVVSRYLEAVTAGKGKRGRKRTPESISLQISRIDQEITEASAIRKLELTQRRSDLVAEKERLMARVDLTSVEKDFVKVAKSYSVRNGISYASFRALGVPADVLKKAGIPRTRG